MIEIFLVNRGQTILTENTQDLSKNDSKFDASQDQKTNRHEICRIPKERAKNEPEFVKFVLSADETWVYDYDIGQTRLDQ